MSRFASGFRLRIRQLWRLIERTITGFFVDDALTQGAAIAYYTIFSIAPVLIIVIGIAGLVFGQDAARHAMMTELGGLMGARAALMVQHLVEDAGGSKAGMVATAIGFATMIVMATGVFAQMQAALNRIWRADSEGMSVTALVKTRLVSLGLVATLGFLLLVSLVVGAAVHALGDYFDTIVPGLRVILQVVSATVSFVLTAILFAAVFKILPDKAMDWRDVSVGSIVTAVLFTLGKFLIGLYIGSSEVASAYGAAAALVIMLLWVYYSAQIFLLGAEFTRAFAVLHGSQKKPQQGDRAKDPGRAADGGRTPIT